MKVTIDVGAVDHYEMDDNKGVKVQLLGDYNETNNRFGIDISESKIKDYAELQYLKQHKNKLPARFKADMEFVSVKDKNKNVVTAASFKNLEFVTELEIVPKQPVKA